MRSRYKFVLIIVILALIAVLSLLFYMQKNMINKFSSETQRLELIFDKDSESLKTILAEEEYISEKYLFKIENSTDNNKRILLIEKDKYNKDEFFKDKFIDYLKIRLNDIDALDVDSIETRDYSNSSRVLSEFNKGTKLLIAILGFIVIIIFLVGRIKTIIYNVRTDLGIYYVKEIIRNKTVEILEELIKLVILFFGGIFLLQWIIKLKFNIPRMYLPPNDIFDFKFYSDLSSSFMPALSNYGNLYNDTLNKVKLLMMAIAIIGIIILVCILIIFKKDIQKQINKESLSENKE